MVFLVACSSSSKNFFPPGQEQGGAAGTPAASGGISGKSGGGAKGGSSGASAAAPGAGNGGSGSGVGGAGASGGTGGSAVAGRPPEAGTGGGDETGGSGNTNNQGGTGATGGACDDSSGNCAPAVCASVNHVEVPLDLFGDVRDQHTVVRMGDRFALYATDRALRRGGADIAFVSWDGIDAHEHFELDNPCPDDICATSLGLSAVETSAGDPELLMVDRGSGAAMSTYPIRAVAWDSTQASPGLEKLFEARADFQTTSELASSKNGERAVFAAGSGGGVIDIAELGTGAELVVQVSTLTPPSGTGWDCLDVVPTKEGAAVSVVSGGVSDTEARWILRELDADGNTVFEVNSTVPAGAALGYTGCPMVAESPVGFHAVWYATDKESVMATALRASGTDAPLTITSFPNIPGTLVGGRSDMLVFLVVLDDGRVGFRGIDENGNDVAKLYVLPPLPARTAEHARTFPMLLSVEGSSLYVSYELETTRVIEQVVCD